MSEGLVSILASALLLGSMYALLTAGMSLIWSTLQVFNYAHGATLVIGGYLIWSLTEHGVPVLLATVLATIAMAGAGALVELVAVRPLASRPDGTLMVMVATLALASASEGIAQIMWGPQNKQLPALTTATFDVAGVAVRWTTVVALLMAVGLVGTLIAVVNRTGWGAGIRAVAQNRDMAMLLGIRPGRIYMSVFAVAAGLATAGALVFATTTTLTPTKGSGPLLTAFVVLVFGGTASLVGTLVGAYVIGLLEASTSYWIGLQWSPVAVFALLVVVMLVRPEGLVRRRAS
ncbi:branched-chain amino acid ABC transporter permease [Nocardioides kongjuensis]|uniref:Branched-chain amino acid transport system permease protein n=1 Tax=Nocardioides kongjuensis TaxID=349522 RepID=A0A852RUE7_9ACTN|nr:branched-chain amino acid ABC transporter permease [Nocardioides kongjuensis]NYD32500.1 branched-chain amino acid transport system permease protein [Nocardioides kongjuensis]